MAEPEPKFEDGLPEDYVKEIPSGYFEARNREMKLASLYKNSAKAALVVAGVATTVSSLVAVTSAFAVAADIFFRRLRNRRCWIGGIGDARQKMARV